MNRIVNILKIFLFVLFFIVIKVNAHAQTTIYQTGFETFIDSTMLGTNVAYSTLKNDGWLTNDSSIQATKPSIYFSALRPQDEFRNAWTVSDAYHSDVCGMDPTCISAIKPIQGKSLCMSAYWGLNGTTFYEHVSFVARCNGFTNYYTDLVTDRWAYRVIPTTGKSNITVSFQWKCNGMANNDYGQLGYSLDGGGTWTWLTTGGTANGQYYGQQTNVQNPTVALPAACDNQNNLAIGFRFKCAGNGGNQDLNTRYPGFMVDNLVVKSTVVACVAPSFTTQPASPAPQCSPASANFTVTANGDAPIIYQWQVNNGGWTNISDGGVNPAYSGTATTSLNVSNATSTLQYRCVAVNCTDSTKFSNAATLTVYAPVNFTLNDLDLCTDAIGGKTLKVITTGTKTYLWSTGSTVDSITVPPIDSSYTVTITDSNSCSASKTASVKILPYPADFLQADTTLCNNSSIVVRPNSTFSSYQWQDGSNGSSIIIKTQGTYRLTVTNDAGCSGVDSIKVINECPPVIYVPTAFTPGEKSINNMFYTPGSNITGYSIDIFNKWGGRVFHSDNTDINNPDNGWDGKFNNTDCAIGVYVYIIHYEGQYNGATQKKTLKGSIALIR